ncbi:hypothetical protein L6R46_19265 [Myxococcota bacterium]|jgi:hypothetical protein|nr:hypothetical protein [Myxococcota bacterium]
MAGGQQTQSQSQNQTQAPQNSTQIASNPQNTSRGASPAAPTNLPEVTANLNLAPPIPVGPIVTPGATITGSLDLGGTLKAKPVGSTNPGSVSPTGATIGSNGNEVGAGQDGVSAKLSSTLGGITNSISVNLNGGSPTVTFGTAGAYGSVETSISGNTITYKCTSQSISRVIDGVQITGEISYTLTLTVTPNPQPQPWYVQVWDAITSSIQAFANWVWDNKEVILVGTVVVAAGVAIVATGGAAAPALAPAFAS